MSLIICAHNEENYIGDCLKSVLTNGHGKFLEVIVVDNASVDKTSIVASSFPGVRVVLEENKGLTHARARGLKEARGDLLAYIDADCRLPLHWVSKAEKIFSDDKKVISLSGPYRYYDGTILQRWIMNCIWWISAPVTYWLVGYMILGGNFIARKEALLSIGGFDTSIEFYGEDTDIARRLHTQGRSIFKMDFFIYSSLRRMASEGIIRTNIVYALNFISEAFFHKPFTKTHTDIRESSQEKK
jgi:glycosyltransferase involved in cell wall biosynthesis